MEFEDEYAHLFRPAKSPLKMPLDWRDHVRLRAGACDGTVVLNQRYDDDAALADDPPPLAPGDLVVVAPEDGVGDPYEASVQPGGDDTHVVVKELGKSSEAIRHTSPRLGGGGPKSRRGAYVAAMQTSILAQAFANAFGVRLFLLMTTKGRKLRVVRVEPRNGKRVLINGYAVAHLGGVCFDSVERHHDVLRRSENHGGAVVQRRVAATPRLPRGYSAEACCGDAAVPRVGNRLGQQLMGRCTYGALYWPAKTLIVRAGH